MGILEWSDYFVGAATAQILSRLGSQNLPQGKNITTVTGLLVLKLRVFSPNYNNITGKTARVVPL